MGPLVSPPVQMVSKILMQEKKKYIFLQSKVYQIILYSWLLKNDVYLERKGRRGTSSWKRLLMILCGIRGRRVQRASEDEVYRQNSVALENKGTRTQKTRSRAENQFLYCQFHTKNEDLMSFLCCQKF